MTKEWCGTSTRSLITLRIHSLRCLLGDGLRGEGLGISSPLLGCHQVRGEHRAPVMDVPCDYTAQVPAFLRERGGASDSFPRQSAPTSSCASEACTRSANCAKAGDSTVQFFDVVLSWCCSWTSLLTCPCWPRHGGLSRFRSCSSSTGVSAHHGYDELMRRLFRAVYTGTRPGLTPSIRAEKGWRGRRELDPRCSATRIGCMLRRRVWRDAYVVHKVRTTTTTTNHKPQPPQPPQPQPQPPPPPHSVAILAQAKATIARALSSVSDAQEFCVCLFRMLRPYVVFWNASLWSLSGNAGDAAQPAPSLVNSEVNLHMVELEYEGFVESPSTSGVSGWVYYLVVVIQTNMSVFLRPLASSCVRFFVIDGLRALFLPVHVMVSAHWFLLLEFLCGAHMVRAAGETVYVLLVYVCSAALIAAPLLAALGGPAHDIFREGFAPCCFQDIGAAMRAAAFAACFAASHCTTRTGWAEAQQLHGALSLVCVLYVFVMWSACSLEDCCPR